MKWRQAGASARLALVVSPFLILVNHFDQLARGEWSGLGFKAGLTFLVPFLVSFYSATAALRDSDARAATRPPRARRD